MDLTIFTVTYNRADLLWKLYESIKKLSNKHGIKFEWLVVVNGCTDNTIDVVRNIESEGMINFRYEIIEENNGLTRAINFVHGLERGTYVSRIDDDDVLLENFIDVFAMHRQTLDVDESLCGMILNMQDQKGDLIGSKFKVDDQLATDYEIYFRHKTTGDKVRIYKSVIRSNYSYQTFKDELYVPDSLVYLRMDSKYKLLCVNDIVAERIYLQGGLTESGKKLKRENTRGMLLQYKELFLHPQSTLWLKLKFRLGFLKTCYEAELTPKDVIEQSDEDWLIKVLSRPIYVICNIVMTK